MKKRTRLESSVRKEQLIAAGITVASTKGYNNIQRIEIADLAGCSEANVTYHFNNMNQLKKAVLKYAVKNKVLAIIAQGLAAQDTYVIRHTDEGTRKKALATLV